MGARARSRRRPRSRSLASRDALTEAAPHPLQHAGWDAAWETSLSELGSPEFRPARVLRCEAHVVTVLTDAGELLAHLPARMRAGEARPTVGDWVALMGPREETRVEHILPRRTAFVRRASGRRRERQVVAANVDVVYIVSSLDTDFNPRRLERYLTAVREGGAAAVVLLTKAGLVDEGTRGVFVARAEQACPGVSVLPIDVITGFGVEGPAMFRRPGATSAVVGSSGVGKSTLVNAWLGEARQKTHQVRARDHRGQHTTTRRELFALPDGSWVIDTPGMRELALWGQEDSLDQAFPDIEGLAHGCRFADCRHEQEPECALREAVARGLVTAERLASYRQLRAELEQALPEQERRSRGRPLARVAREALRAKRR